MLKQSFEFACLNDQDSDEKKTLTIQQRDDYAVVLRVGRCNKYGQRKGIEAVLSRSDFALLATLDNKLEPLVSHGPVAIPLSLSEKEAGAIATLEVVRTIPSREDKPLSVALMG